MRANENWNPDKRRNMYPPKTALDVFPRAIPRAANAGIGLKKLVTKAPSAIPGQTS
jgi:hypothetical protein